MSKSPWKLYITANVLCVHSQGMQHVAGNWFPIVPGSSSFACVVSVARVVGTILGIAAPRPADVACTFRIQVNNRREMFFSRQELLCSKVWCGEPLTLLHISF